MSNQAPSVPARIKQLQPYVCARHTCKGDDWIFLDANESPKMLINPFAIPDDINRYPDPTADVLRDAISKVFGIRSNEVILSNGADELIDLVIRTFVRSNRSVLSVSPTYGMYKVCSDISGILYEEVPLNDNFELDVDALITKSQKADVMFLCSPNNPTGSTIEINILRKIAEDFSGLLIVDEAYGEFADAIGNASAVQLVKDAMRNVLVLRTFSKAFGAAGIRLGYGISCESVISDLIKVKPPYNVNSVSQKIGLQLWKNSKNMKENVMQLIQERKRVEAACYQLNCIVYASNTNFLLIRLPKNKSTSEFCKQLALENIVIRNVSNKPELQNAIRFSIGTPKQNDCFVSILTQFLS